MAICDRIPQAPDGAAACASVTDAASPWVDFSGIGNPLGTPDDMVEAIKRYASLAESLPETDTGAARAHLSKRFGIDGEAFLCGTSLSDMIASAAIALGSVPVGVMAPCPTSYATALRRAECPPVRLVQRHGFCTPDPSLASYRNAPFDAALLSNPGYPGSRLLSKTTLRRYLDEKKWVIVDEQSIELSLGGESMIPLVLEYKNLVVVRSFSAAFALPGVPAGFLAAHPDTVRTIERRAGVEPSLLAEVLCQQANEHQDYLERTRDVLEAEIPWLQCMLSLVPGIAIYPAEANYVLARLVEEPPYERPVATSAELAARLQERGLAISPFSAKPGLPDNRHFCVSVRTRPDNERLVSALRDIMIGD